MCLIYRLEVWDDDILLHHHLDRAARMRRSWNHAINAGGLRVTLSWTGPPPPTPTCLPSLDKSKSCSFTVLQQPSNRSRGSEKHAPISDIIYEVDCRTLATCGIPHFRHLGSLKVKASKKSRRNFWKTKSLYFSDVSWFQRATVFKIREKSPISNVNKYLNFRARNQH